MRIEELHKQLEKLGDPKNVEGMKKFAIDGNAFGVKIPVLRKIAIEIKDADLDFLNQLWETGILEDRLIACLLFNKLCKKLDAETQIKAVEHWTALVKDWSACDQLASNWRPWLNNNQEVLFNIANNWINSKNLWTRRFILACLVVISQKGNKNKVDVLEVLQILDKVMLDKEKYVQKAIHWVLREITWRDEQAVFEFIKKWLGRTPRSTLWQGSEKLPKELREKLR